MGTRSGSTHLFIVILKMPGGITVVPIKCPKCVYYTNGKCRLFNDKKVEYCVQDNNLCGLEYKFFKEIIFNAQPKQYLQGNSTVKQ